MTPSPRNKTEEPGDTVTRLYSLLPGEFTAARNAEAAAAARAGEPELGKRFKALPKPSSAAWLANMLIREEGPSIAGVLALGASLREAQADLDRDELRRLNAERHRTLRTLAREARELAGRLGNPVSAAVAAEVEQTLWAAMTDPDAAAALASGRLVRGLEANGWEPVELDGAVADPDSAAPLVSAAARNRSAPGSAAGKSPEKKGTSRQQQAARAKARKEVGQALDEAREAAAQAEHRLAEVQSEVESQASFRDGLTDEIDDLRERIRELEREVSELDRRRGTLERSRDKARREARAARRAVERAEAKLDSLN